MWTHFNIQDEKMILCVHIRQKENLEMQQLLLNSLVLLIRTIAIVQRILLSRITGGKLEVNKLLRKVNRTRNYAIVMVFKDVSNYK